MKVINISCFSLFKFSEFFLFPCRSRWIEGIYDIVFLCRCGHCKKLAPEYEKLGASFKKAKSVLIGKVSLFRVGHVYISCGNVPRKILFLYPLKFSREWNFTSFSTNKNALLVRMKLCLCIAFLKYLKHHSFNLS